MRLSLAEIKEADSLGNITGAAQQQVVTARANLNTAALANINQSSVQWANLCNNLENAIKSLDAATTAELQWWRSKGFNV